MAATDIKKKIAESINAFSKGNLTENSLRLFEVLGYNTDRQAPLSSPTYTEFKASFVDGNPRFKEDKALVKEWKYIDLLFQLSKEEISQQHSLFDTKRVDNTVIESYLFFVIELADLQYNRTAISQITREVNKLFPMPSMILFKHGEALTLAIINRRLHKRDEGKDVLLKVTLIKDINIANPHRAHIEILFDLTFGELLKEYKFTNFVELHNAWQKTLDTKELNKRFYQELANWYFWAMKEVYFPGVFFRAGFNTDALKDPQVREHNAKNLIRLLTRILFVWFIKEKHLIPEELFDEKYLKDSLLKDFEPRKRQGLNYRTQGSKYYRAVLQNLFFATLNQTMGKREFRKNGQHMNVTNLMRYESYFKNPTLFIDLVEKVVPFMNGGLFECLDTPHPDKKGRQGGDVIIYIDGFSDRPDNQLMVPDYIFFDLEEHVDLSEDYGDKSKFSKDASVRGLINLLRSYKFTVAENTPIEEEVALDPELLGMVFENLLASYNPETKTTARKQTGSFYTPREIVNYMVDESLKAYLKQKLTENGDMKEEDADVGLDFLFEYNEKEHLFNEYQTEVLIKAIDNCKILDPACGSGAFPMGALQKMVHILHKLDPDNARWKERQIEKVRQIDDPVIRDRMIVDVEDAFTGNELDYGRKLYLIENCIYGVDIQPIAVQIAKLRFFISLIVDQTTNKEKENFGISPLPNLETKIVAANTLIGIKKPEGRMGGIFDNREITQLEEKLKDVRHRLFSTKTPPTKRKLREEDRMIRERMGNLLIDRGWGHETARQMAGWDPYDQNASSPFFDLEWMFGLEDGFDVVIGNPPYVRADSGKDHLAMRRQIIDSGQYETLWEKWDFFIPFMEQSYKLLKPGGVTSLIVSDAYCHSKYAQKSQTWFLKNSRILRLDFLSRIKVFDAGVHNLTYFFQKADGQHWKPERRVHEPEFGAVKMLPTDEQSKLNYRVFFPGDGQKSGLSPEVTLIGQICYVTKGMVVHANERIVQGAFEMKDLIADNKDDLHPKPFVEGKHLDAWLPTTNKWLEWGTERAPKLFSRPTFPEIYGVEEKLLVQRSPGPDPKSCYDSERLHFTESSVGFVLWHSLAGVRNKSIKKSARYRGEKPLRPDLPEREQLEETSKHFAVKYLLAVMNSTIARDFLRANRRSNIHLYPEDWKKLPIPEATPEQQTPIISLVDQILGTKRADLSADVSSLEAQADDLVSALYGLDSKEIRCTESDSYRQNEKSL